MLARQTAARGSHGAICKFLNNAEDTHQVISSYQHRHHFGLESKLDKLLEVQVGESELHFQGYISLPLLAIEFEVSFQCLPILSHNHINHVRLPHKAIYLCLPSLRLVAQIFVSDQTLLGLTSERVFHSLLLQGCLCLLLCYYNLQLC